MEKKLQSIRNLNHGLEEEGNEDGTDCHSVDKNNNPAHREEMRPRAEEMTCVFGSVATLQPKPWADLTKKEVEEMEEEGNETKGKAAEAKRKGWREKEILP